MFQLKEFLLPDIGADAANITEIFVSVGDSIALDQDILSIEGDKAEMDVPSSVAGIVKEIKVSVGDDISEGALVLTVESTVDSDANAVNKKAPATKTVEKPVVSSAAEITTVNTSIKDVCVPDIGGDEVEVIEIMFGIGDSFVKDQDILSVEGDKASMDIPAPFAGTVINVKVALGDKVSQGTVIYIVTSAEATAVTSEADTAKMTQTSTSSAGKVMESEPVKTTAPPVPDHPCDHSQSKEGSIYTSPSVRRLSREFGVDLKQVSGTGRKNRILKEDVQQFVKYELSRPKANASNIGGGNGIQVIPYPLVDYAQFGEIEIKPLSRIQKISGPTLHRNWVTIPHVTQFDEADITDLEAFRKEQNAIAAKKELGIKISPLVFMMKAVAKALQDYPHFNASLSSDGESLILKKYINIGIAVDTPNGLVVPVVKDVISRGINDLSRELGDISKKARVGKLTKKDMQGGSMTISSLGGIGGTQFSPIVNAPEVAILGVSKAAMKPLWNGKEFLPRLLVPLALSYDHRVVDGADGARFITAINHYLSDLRTLIL